MTCFGSLSGIMEPIIIHPLIILCFRTTALHCPLSFEGNDQNWSSNEVHGTQFPQSLPRTPTTTLSMGSGSYTVLPPIRKPMTGKESESSPCQSVSTAYPVHRSNSDGYLVQMEKQKQLRAKVTYKVGVSVSFICILAGRTPMFTNISSVVKHLYLCFISVLSMSAIISGMIHMKITMSVCLICMVFKTVLKLKDHKTHSAHTE